MLVSLISYICCTGNSGRRTSGRPGHSRNTSIAGGGGGNYPYMNAAATSSTSFKSGNNMHRSQSTIPSSPTHQNTFDQLMSGIDKLFSERVEYFGLVDGTHSGILMSIVKVLVKVMSCGMLAPINVCLLLQS